MTGARPGGVWAIVGLFGVAATLGIGHVFGRLAFSNGVTVLTAATVRSVCASALLLLLLRWRRTPVWPLPREFRALLLIGVCITAQTVLVQIAVARLPVTLAILLFYTYPFMTGVAQAVVGGERFTPLLGVALAAAFTGLILVLGANPGAVSVSGIAAALAAAVSFSAALVLTPRLAPALGAPLRTFFTIGTAATIFVSAACVMPGFHVPASGPALTGLLGLSACYAVGIVVLFRMLPLVGPTRTAFVLNLEPVIVAVVSWLTLGETLGPVQMVGAVIVVGTVIGFQSRAGRS